MTDVPPLYLGEGAQSEDLPPVTLGNNAISKTPPNQRRPGSNSADAESRFNPS